MICVIISDSVKDQLCCLPWRVNCTFAELFVTKSSMGCFILSIVLEPSTDCNRFSYVIILLRMCNWAKISYMPWFQALLFQYKSSASSEIAECKRVKVNILLVAVCGTFSIVKLVFLMTCCRLIGYTRKVFHASLSSGFYCLIFKWYTEILLILRWFNADWMKMITLLGHLPFWNCCVQREVIEAFSSTDALTPWLHARLNSLQLRISV